MFKKLALTTLLISLTLISPPNLTTVYSMTNTRQNDNLIINNSNQQILPEYVQKHMDKIKEYSENNDNNGIAKTLEELSEDSKTLDPDLSFLSLCYSSDYYIKAENYKDALRVLIIINQESDIVPNKVRSFGLMAVCSFYLEDYKKSNDYYEQAKTIVDNIPESPITDSMYQFLKEIKNIIASDKVIS